MNFVIASAAKQSRAAKQVWIASSQVLLAMTEIDRPNEARKGKFENDRC
jgi:hypothetical protein